MTAEDTDAQFKSMTDDILTNEANLVLEKMLERASIWRAERRVNGADDGLADFIRQISREPNKRPRILGALGAAMWRLMEENRG